MKQNIDFHTISLTGRLCYLFMCFEQYVTACYPEKDWTLVAQKCWQWTNHYWNEGCDIYAQIIPEFLFEFDDYEQTNEQFDGNLSKNDYEQFSFLYKDVCIEEINQLFMLGIDFDNACEGSDFSNADDITIDILEKAQMILSRYSSVIWFFSESKEWMGRFLRQFIFIYNYLKQKYSKLLYFYNISNQDFHHLKQSLVCNNQNCLSLCVSLFHFHNHPYPHK